MSSLDAGTLDKAQQVVKVGETLTIEDNEIELNSNVTGAPTEDAGVRVNRGSSTDARLLWDESEGKWKVGLEGSEQDLLAQSGAVNTSKLFVDSAGNDTTGDGSA